MSLLWMRTEALTESVKEEPENLAFLSQREVVRVTQVRA